MNVRDGNDVFGGEEGIEVEKELSIMYELGEEKKFLGLK